MVIIMIMIFICTPSKISWTLLYTVFFCGRRTTLVAEGAVEAPEQGAGQRRKDLKEFTLEEVAKHDSIENRYIFLNKIIKGLFTY